MCQCDLLVNRKCVHIILNLRNSAPFMDQSSDHESFVPILLYVLCQCIYVLKFEIKYV